MLDVRTDPSIPPIPPHATFQQAKDAAAALLKGDPDAWPVLKEGLMAKARGNPPRQERLTTPKPPRQGGNAPAISDATFPLGRDRRSASLPSIRSADNPGQTRLRSRRMTALTVVGLIWRGTVPVMTIGYGEAIWARPDYRREQ